MSGNGAPRGDDPVSQARRAVLALYLDNPSVDTARLIVQMEELLAAQQAPQPDPFTLWPSSSHVLSVGGLTLDVTRRTVTRHEDDMVAVLTIVECRVLALLMRDSGRVLTATQIAEVALGTTAIAPGASRSSSEDPTSTVRSYIRRVRAKIEPDPSNPRYVVRVPGVGYTFLGEREESKK